VSAARRWKEPGWIAAAVALAHGFLPLFPAPPMDRVFVDGNPLLRAPWGEFWAALWSRRYFLATNEATYQPLVTLLHRALGPASTAFRVLALGAHAASAWLTCRIALRLGLSEKTSLLAGLLFAVFPPATEALSVPSFAGHELGLAFALAAVLFGLDALERGSWAKTALCCAALGGALLCKETAVIAPAWLAMAWLCDARPARLSRTLQVLVPSGLLCAAFLLWRFSLPAPPGMMPARAADAVLSLGWYARMLAWPWPLCFEHASVAAWHVAFAGVFVIAGASVAAEPPLLLGYAWLALGLLPYLHFVPFAHTSVVADRYLLFAAPGFILWIARLLDFRLGRAGLAGLALLWLGLTLERNAMLIDEPTVCAQTATCAPDSAPAQLLLGNVLLSRGLAKDAEQVYSRAVEIDGASAVAWSDLGVAQSMAGEHDAAVASFRKSLSIADSPAVRGNLAEALARKGAAASTTTSGRAPKRPKAPGLP
jgi:hypothetical protein